MVDVNPHAPESAGPQWPASRQRSMLTGSTSARTAAVTARTTQTADRAKLFLQSPYGEVFEGGADPFTARYWLDIYNAADFDPGPVRTAYAVPVADGTSTDFLVRSSDNATTNVFTMIDEGPLEPPLGTFVIPPFFGPRPGPGDWVGMPWPQTGAGHDAHGILRMKASTTFNDRTTGAVVSLVGKRILDVRVVGWIAADLGPSPVYVGGLLNYGFVPPTGLPAAEIFLPGADGRFMALPSDKVPRNFAFSSFGARDGSNHGDPYRTTDLPFLQTGGTGLGFGFHVYGIHPSTQGIYLFEMHLEVDYVDEKRLVTSKASPIIARPDPGRWIEFQFLNPSTHAAATFNKTADTQYLIALRQRTNAGGPNAWVGLDTASTAGHEADALEDVLGTDIPLMNGFQQSSGCPAVRDAVADLTYDTTAQGFYFMNVATVRPDSQPYVELQPVLINNGAVYEQEFSNQATASYAIITALIKNDRGAHSAEELLICEIGQRSDNSILGSGSIGIEQLPRIPDDRWYVVNVRLPSTIPLAAGQQYFVRLSSATVFGTWTVMVLSTTTNEAAGQSFGGTTNAATIPGFGEITWFDIVTSAGQLPPAPILLDSVVASWDTDRGLIGPLGSSFACVVPTISYAVLTWQPTTLGSLFYRYEIERNDDGTWIPIAYVADPTTSVFSDFEVRRGIATQWRVRQVRTDGVWSDWSTFDPLTVPAGENEVILASNTNPLKTLGLHEEPGISYERASSQRLITRAMYGRDKVLAFRESEDRGDEFSRRLIFAFNDGTHAASPTQSGRAVYDPLVSLIEDASLPHVAFLDHRGRRWYTAPTIREMGHEEPGGRYVAEVNFVEVAGPTPVSISFGVAPEPPDPIGFYAAGYSEDY